MLFSSLTFLYIFMPLLLAAYFLLKNDNYRNWILIIFSLVFYAWGEPVYILLMLFVVTFNYFFGIIIGECNRKSKRKFYLVIDIILNISLLIFFKYTNLLIDTFNSITHLNISFITIALPLGISFYIFQALTYVIDVYRQEVKAQYSYKKLLLYIAFFPQLVAGPIVRYKDILNDLKSRKTNIDGIYYGIFRFSIGLAKKVLIANKLGLCVSTLIESENHGLSCLSFWGAAICFTLQIYFDFSGYSDMAIGLGSIFGFKFKENFNYPYAANSVTDFWRKWHMSLSTFFRDYLYIPLGGKYNHQIRNIIIVWTLTGLWHGASWNFCLWGLYYAALLIIEKYILSSILNKINKSILCIISHIYVILITIIGFNIFYYTDLKMLLESFKGMFIIGYVPLTDLFSISIIKDNMYLIIVSFILAMPLINNIAKIVVKKLNKSIVVIIEAVIILTLILISTAMLVGESYNPFLYFRF